MVPCTSSSRPTDSGKVSVSEMVEEVLGCKWSVRLLGSIAAGRHRPAALLRACPGLSAKVMNERLRKMTSFGILRRSVAGEKPPVVVEYHLTPLGHRFSAILADVQRLQESLDRGKLVSNDRDEAPEAERRARPARRGTAAQDTTARGR